MRYVSLVLCIITVDKLLCITEVFHDYRESDKSMYDE